METESELTCSICSRMICPHSTIHIKGLYHMCFICNEVGKGEPPPTYCLPSYEGKVDFSSDVYSKVCKQCYVKHSESK